MRFGGVTFSLFLFGCDRCLTWHFGLFISPPFLGIGFQIWKAESLNHFETACSIAPRSTFHASRWALTFRGLSKNTRYHFNNWVRLSIEQQTGFSEHAAGISSWSTSSVVHRGGLGSRRQMSEDWVFWLTREGLRSGQAGLSGSSQA